MRIDAEQILAQLPINTTTNVNCIIVGALCDAFNAAIDSALYSLDPTALERLGTLIAEHALRVRELPRPSEVPDRVADLEKRLARAEALIEGLVGPTVMTIGQPMTFRSLDTMVSEKPCASCREHHRLDAFPIGGTARVVSQRARTKRDLIGRTGSVHSWSQAGGPMSVRLDFGELDEFETPLRENFDPCQLELLDRGTLRP